jgi:hypothetical protein
VLLFKTRRIDGKDGDQRNRDEKEQTKKSSPISGHGNFDNDNSEHGNSGHGNFVNDNSDHGNLETVIWIFRIPSDPVYASTA